MNNIFSNVNFDVSFLKSYLAILKNRQVKHREQTKIIIQQATKELVLYFQHTPLEINEIFSFLTSHLQKNPEILGNAFAFSPEIRSSCPFVFRGINGFESRDIAKGFPYNNSIWYDVPVKKRKAVWSVPYFDIGKAGEDILLTTYSIPVFNEHSMLIGVIISDLLLASIEEIEKME